MTAIDADDIDALLVDDIADYLKCAICLCCLNEPYQTPCGHRFCKECIMPVINSRNPFCPKDRTGISHNNVWPDNAAKLQINSLKIKCPKAVHGCEWVGEVSEKRAHLEKCKFVDVPCVLCGRAILKAEMEHHISSCPRRLVNCDHCNVPVPQAEMKGHYNECPLYHVPCQYSCRTETFLRKDIAAHYEKECPRVPVACVMAPFGCSEQVERGGMGEHMIQCAPKHTTCMADVILALKKEVEDLQAHVSMQAEATTNLENTLYPSSGQFTWRVDDIRLKIKQAQAGDTSTSVIYSPPFYSTEAGYKFCLCIYPAGDNNQGHLSLYFVVMKGQFDEVVSWPFQNRVHLSLLNVKRGQNITKDINPDPRLHYFHRPENPRNVGYGYPKFIALNKLLNEDSEFVENEALFLRCKIFN